MVTQSIYCWLLAPSFFPLLLLGGMFLYPPLVSSLPLLRAFCHLWSFLCGSSFSQVFYPVSQTPRSRFLTKRTTAFCMGSLPCTGAWNSLQIVSWGDYRTCLIYFPISQKSLSCPFWYSISKKLLFHILFYWVFVGCFRWENIQSLILYLPGSRSCFFMWLFL